MRFWVNPTKTTALAADLRPAHQKDRDHLRTDQIFKTTFTNSKHLPKISVRFQCRRSKMWAVFFPDLVDCIFFFRPATPLITNLYVFRSAASQVDVVQTFSCRFPRRLAHFCLFCFHFLFCFFPPTWTLKVKKNRRVVTLWRTAARGPFAAAHPGTALGKRGQRVSGCGHVSIYVQLFMTRSRQGSNTIDSEERRRNDSERKK